MPYSGNPRRIDANIGGSSEYRRAFSLIELLTVIAIIGIMVGLILPAVQASREQARAALCSNNMKQLALAVLQYEAVHQELPPGYLGPRPARTVSAASSPALIDFDNQQIGFAAFVLPYMEQQSIYAGVGKDMLDLRRTPHYQIWTLNLDTWQAGVNQIASLLCPSTPSASPSGGTLFFLNTYYHDGVKNLMVEAGPYPSIHGRFLGRTNYIGCGGAYGAVDRDTLDEFRGALVNRSPVALSQIADGTGHTLLIGEAVGAMDGDDLTYAYAWMGCGSLPLAFEFGSAKDWNTFSSLHPPRVGFSFVDGSVRYLDSAIEKKILYALGGIGEGVTVEAP